MFLVNQLKAALRGQAKAYAAATSAPITERTSAVIFQRLPDAFCPASYESIQANPAWASRTGKQHSQVPGVLEMQSSNSSDALLMSVFCHPHIAEWQGVQEVLRLRPHSPVFGLMARVPKYGTNGDETEIDMAIDDCLVEAKLTETGFTEKAKAEVTKYEDLTTVFDIDSLPQSESHYRNYQVIRNVLAAVHHHKRHVLLCDHRRPDLARDYYETVACVREIGVRRRCRVIFWQEIAEKAGETLRGYLCARYGMC